jgi:type I restriction-modification system DNA methylase subunit
MDKLNNLNKLIEKLTYRRNRWEVLTDLFEVSAITISNKFDLKRFNEREKRYLEIVKKYDTAEMQLMCEAFAEIYKILSGMIDHGFDDYLGKLYMDSRTSSDKAGQFFTPYCISQMCAQVGLDNERLKSSEILTMHEPTCGSGGMILATVEELHKRGFNYSYNMFVECGDIDSRCVHMCYLQLSLAGVPAAIYHRNGLTLETWDVWHTPALCMNWLRFRKMVEK